MLGVSDENVSTVALSLSSAEVRPVYVLERGVPEGTQVKGDLAWRRWCVLRHWGRGSLAHGPRGSQRRGPGGHGPLGQPPVRLPDLVL